MNVSYEDRLHIWLSIALEGNARAGLAYEAHNGGLPDFYERVLSGDADFGRSSPERIARLKSAAQPQRIDALIEELEKNGVTPVTKADPFYPALLREIDDPPYVLYAKGACVGREIKLPLAVVGTRRCTDYGEKVASMMGEALAENGVTVVSGLADGCDSFAHEGALRAKNSDYPTLAVLGQGILVPKHDRTAKTMAKILERGMVVSEFLPHTPASKTTFPIRNRIISGISNGVLVVEAGKKSGTMITVGCALDQGRNVYAVPCRITEAVNCGTNEMLAEGMASPVYGVDDLLSQLGLVSASNAGGEKKAVKLQSPAQKALYELIAYGEKSFDTLLEKSGLSVEELNLHLTDMEFSGLIKQLPGRVYTLN